MKIRGKYVKKYAITFELFTSQINIFKRYKKRYCEFMYFLNCIYYQVADSCELRFPVKIPNLYDSEFVFNSFFNIQLVMLKTSR